MSEQSQVLFECCYGPFRPRYFWLFGTVGLIGIVGVPVGIFWNTGWEMANRPVEPWAATLMIEIFAIGALLVAGFAIAVNWYHRDTPQRIAVTGSDLILPKRAFTTAEIELPLDEIKLAVFGFGPVKQLQVKHRRKKVLLTSPRFAANEDFDRLVEIISR